eukprot:224377_1
MAYYLPLHQAIRMLMKRSNGLAEVFYLRHFVLPNVFETKKLHELQMKYTKTAARPTTELSGYLHGIELINPAPYVADRSPKDCTDQTAKDEWDVDRQNEKDLVSKFAIADSFIPHTADTHNGRVCTVFGTLLCVEFKCDYRDDVHQCAHPSNPSSYNLRSTSKREMDEEENEEKEEENEKK